MKKSANFGAGIIIVCAILLPFVDILPELKADSVIEDLFENMDYDGATDSTIELAFEEGIAEYIALEYKVSESDVLVTVDGFDMEKLLAERVYVTLRGGAVLLDYKRLEDELGKQFTCGGECEVSINIG